MDLSEINWDVNEAGAWPKPVKIGAGILVFLLIVGFWYFKFTDEQLTKLEAEEKAVDNALISYQTSWRMALNLELHQKQYKQIEASLHDMMKLMPTKAEVANLLVDISQTGLSSGLEFELFKPTGQIDKGDVVELPIDIKVLGRYGELGLFISGLATLPRIVTIKDIKIKPAKNDPRLFMNAVITTYREGGGGKDASTADVMNNQSLVCLDHDGMQVKGCKRRSNVVVSYVDLAARLKEKRIGVQPIKVDAIEPMPPVESYLFDPDGLRDPFRESEKTIGGAMTPYAAISGIQPDFNRHQEELESYSLDTLRMVGIVKMNDVIWGLILTSEGAIHRVKRGNYLGENHGKILRILTDKIELMEIVPDQPGVWREEQRAIALSESNSNFKSDD
ncbi:MAG: type 4a pilus biogenesis protein PilO [Methyloprofundus sp.]|nr:type 4a pilus biogenesis protein PilO [Methyloprofundus sp.]